jgi:Ca2+-binding EF-hand superfamily protein
MEEMLSSQNEKLDETLRKLSRLHQTSQQPPEPLKPWHGMSITEINAIKLPLDITTWRTAHVQAWLSLKLDLPQYIQAFHDCSIDGLVLLKHIDADTLEETVGVSAPLHRLKILEGIESLRKRQSDYESKKRASQKLTPEPPVAEEKPKKEKPRKTKPRASQTIFGDVKEHNELEKIRLERLMKEKRKEEKKRRKKLADQHELWKFEYTGAAAKPGDSQDDISDLLRGKAPAAANSSKYEKMMKSIFETTDLLPSAEENPAATTPAPPLKLRQIPLDSPYDEVLAITRAAMFEVSSRLLKIYQIEKLRELRQNTDLDPTAAGSRYGDDLIEQTMRGTHKTDPSASVGADDESLPPPLYTEEEEEQEGEGEDASRYEEREEHEVQELTIPPISRSQLLFSAFANQRNNDARWLGPNSKLTRLKFHGGFESVLRLKIQWPQFDALWTKLDYRRSGELDQEEFTTFFGDFQEFEASQSPSSASASASFRGLSSASRPQTVVVDQLTALMYEICTIFRQNQFTVAEIFKSFDRNGSGAISVSEFHSFLRVVLGPGAGSAQDFYRMFAYLDRDNSRSISCQEISLFVYLVWRSQLKDLAYRISTLDVDIPEERQLIDKILRERNQIKEAVKKNFSREWRDLYERMDQEEACCQGPFGHILKRLGVTTRDKTAAPTPAFASVPAPGTLTGSQRDPRPPSSSCSSSRPLASAGGRVSSKTAPSGKNELLKFRIQQSSRTQQIPTRKGAVLAVPPTQILGSGENFVAEGSALRFLQQTNPAGNQVFSMTSQL